MQCKDGLLNLLLTEAPSHPDEPIECKQGRYDAEGTNPETYVFEHIYLI